MHLITLSFLEDRLGSAVDDPGRALALIEDVSAAVELHTERTFTEPVPPVIGGLVAHIVGRALGTPSSEAGVSQESLGSYSYTIGTAAGAGPFGLLADEWAILNRFRPQVRTIQHGSWL